MKQKLRQAKDNFSFDTENRLGQLKKNTLKKVMKKPVMEMVVTPARHVHEMSGKVEGNVHRRAEQWL